jgi:hypothetical protein
MFVAQKPKAAGSFFFCNKFVILTKKSLDLLFILLLVSKSVVCNQKFMFILKLKRILKSQRLFCSLSGNLQQQFVQAEN